MRTVLVTGATGFLGRRVVARLLREGVRVRALVRQVPADLPAEVEAVTGDLADDAAVAAAAGGADGVVHAGARVATTGSWEAFAEINIRGTRRVIAAARAAGARRIVHVSSLSVYAVDRDGVTITEESPYESEANARGHYSRSKLAADRVALAAARAGAPVVVLRPGLLYGPGRRPPLARQSVALRGWQLILARPDYPVPLSYVDNVADAVWLALVRPGVEGQAFTVVDDNIRQNELVSLYRAAAGETWRPVFLPIGMVAAAAGVAERGLRLAGRRSPVTYHQVRRATDRAWYDCGRAAQVLGWRPVVPVAEGLRRSFAAQPAAA